MPQEEEKETKNEEVVGEAGEYCILYFGSHGLNEKRRLSYFN